MTNSFAAMVSRSVRVCCRRMLALLLLPGAVCSAEAEVKFISVASDCGVRIEHDSASLLAHWKLSDANSAQLKLNLEIGQPLIQSLSLQAAGGEVRSVIEQADPLLLLTVGERDLSKKDGWVAFFDNPYKRPNETFRAQLDKRVIQVSSVERRVTIEIDGLTAGRFAGKFLLTIFADTNLIRLEAALSTDEDGRAIAYDLGLAVAGTPPAQLAYIDNDDKFCREMVAIDSPAETLEVRYRTLAIQTPGGSMAIFPPSHQFLYPLDFADNYGFVWRGRNWRQQSEEWSFGVTQPREGDHRFVPWINAPPGSLQRLSAFCVLTPEPADACLDEVKKYTHNDRFAKVDGYRTFTSHYHIEHTLEYLRLQAAAGNSEIPSELEQPPFVTAFKNQGVDIVHLAEFHVGRTPEFFASRLSDLQLMHEECARLSDESLLVLPGEEPNAHLGGHWISLFPKPVYWTFDRSEAEPFVEEVPPYGKVYHVGSSEDVLKLMEAEQGLMWTAHPRIKSSLGFPDEYRRQEFFTSDRFLGAAWKAMPADLSFPRLGSRSLDLLDDMANWGHQKYVLGEVDVFRVQPDYELYGHSNVNYLRLDSVPRFADGWQSVLDALSGGRFFVTTGEVLIRDFTINGKQSGDILHLPADGSVILEAAFEWTFPLAFAEVVSGDGKTVMRERIPLENTGPFGTDRLQIPLQLAGRKWARVEIWDVAANGVFTQPIWISE